MFDVMRLQTSSEAVLSNATTMHFSKSSRTMVYTRLVRSAWLVNVAGSFSSSSSFCFSSYSNSRFLYSADVGFAIQISYAVQCHLNTWRGYEWYMISCVCYNYSIRVTASIGRVKPRVETLFFSLCTPEVIRMFKRQVRYVLFFLSFPICRGEAVNREADHSEMVFVVRQPPCFSVSDIFGNISSFIMTMCPAHVNLL